MAFVIFYSWQSDLPNKTNRTLIGDALENSATSLQQDTSITVEPVVDRDTAGVPGAPDIALTIFRKIEKCQVFVGDVSLVNAEAETRRMPNPNVLVELGYALKALGPERVVLVMNTAFGGPEQLPFDLRMRRVLSYNSSPEASERAPERKSLERALSVALRAVIEHHAQEAPPPTSEPPLAARVMAAIQEGQRSQDSLTRAYMSDIAMRLDRLAPDFDAAEKNGVELDDSLLAALEDSKGIFVEFGTVCRTVGEYDATSAAETMYQGFGRIMDRYELPPRFSGSYRRVDFDFFKFVGHEMFVMFIASLVENDRWNTLRDLLAELIYVERNNQGEAAALPFTEISHTVELLEFRKQRLKSRQYSLHADLLNERHSNGSLAEYAPMTAFTDADYFLFLRTELPPDDPRRTVPWAPWSVLYLGNRPPRYFLTAQRRDRAIQIAEALGLGDIEQLRQRLEERGNGVQRMYMSAHHLAPLRRVDLSLIGSR